MDSRFISGSGVTEKLAIRIMKIIEREVDHGEHDRSSHARVARLAAFLSFFPVWTKVVLSNLVAFFYGKERSSKRDDSINYVVFNSTTKLDRISQFIEAALKARSYVQYYLLSTSLFSMLREKRETQSGFILVSRYPLVADGISSFSVRIQSLLSTLVAELSAVGVSVSYRSQFEISSYLLLCLYQYEWAMRAANRLVEQYPKAAFIFDLDESGKELFLAHAVNLHNRKTVLIQHGAMVNPYFYVPTCRYMLCCSKRDREDLIRIGVREDSVLIYGQPLQTMHGLEQVQSPSSGSIFILAGNGSAGFVSDCAELLKGSRHLKSCERLVLKTHPKAAGAFNKMWRFNRNIRIVHDRLIEHIAEAQVVITFSVDALISVVRQKRAAIVCRPEGHNTEGLLAYLSGIKNVHVATNSRQLDEMLEGILREGQIEIDYDIRQIEDRFGRNVTREHFNSLLEEISSR